MMTFADKVGKAKARPSWKVVGPGLVLAAVLIAVGLTVYSTTVVVVLVAAAAVGVLIFLRPEVGTLVGVFALYSNITVLAFRLHGAPRAFAFSFLVLFGLPFIYYVFFQKKKIIVDRNFRFMLILLLGVLASTALSKDPALALDWIAILLSQGLVTYFLVVNVVRTEVCLERVITVLLCTGALLGLLALYQELSNDYANQFFGLAQRNLEHVKDPSEFALVSREHVRLSHRAGGPLREANYFAQMLIFLLPLAWFRLRHRRGIRRLTATGLTLLILAGLFLTYSRGGFLALMLIGFLALRWKLIRLRTVAVGVLAGALFLTLAAPGYFNRIGSLSAVSGLLSERSDIQPDGAIAGRATEMLAALSVFIDHPILGVGPAHYSPYYSVAYQTNSDMAFRLIERTRRAHSLYFEMAAELGLVGLGLLLSMLGMTALTLARLRRGLRFQEPYLSDLAAAGLLSLLGLLSTALFLQLSYQRYFWFFLAITAALERVVREGRQRLYTEARVIDTELQEDEDSWAPSPIDAGRMPGTLELPARG